MTLACSSDSPKRSPRPLSACAAEVSVWFSLIGSTFSAIDVTVSNSVLNSVVTDSAGITSPLETCCGEGSFGELKATYLLPNTVLARMSATTLVGISGR